jgi:hypothetical protein
MMLFVTVTEIPSLQFHGFFSKITIADSYQTLSAELKLLELKCYFLNLNCKLYQIGKQKIADK